MEDKNMMDVRITALVEWRTLNLKA